MKAFKIWSRAQLYNLLIWILVYLGVLVINMTHHEGSGEIGFLMVVLTIIILISVIAGLPLILIFHLILLFIESLNIKTSEQKIILTILLPISIGLYVNTLLVLLLQDEFFRDWNSFILFSLPSMIATGLSTFFQEMHTSDQKSLDQKTIDFSESQFQ
jgi:hypothetical protein